MLTTNYLIYKLPEKKEETMSGNKIKQLLPNTFINRDLRLLKNDNRGDISYLLFKDDIMLIKFDYIAVIILKSKTYCIKFNYDINSEKFIKYIKLSFNKYDKSLSFRKFIFDLILHYLSEVTDDFLEKAYIKYKNLTINKFKSKELTDILTFQHSILVEKNKNQEYYESLLKLIKEENNLEYFLKDRNNKNNKEIEDITHFINNYINRIKEDIKNLDRLQHEINFFIELINIKLGQKRNKYASKALNLEIFSLTYSLSCFFIVIFGINLKNHMEESDYAFYILVLIIILLHIPIFFILRKIFK